MKTTRTDPHCPSNIIPGDYEIVLSYDGPSSEGGIPIPSFGINCELDRRQEKRDESGRLLEVINGKHNADGQCCVMGLLYVAKVTFAATGGTCKCSVCGAAFVHGDVWRHKPTGEHIHIGHTCSAKYQMLADRSEHERQLARHIAAAVRAETARRNQEEREAFLAKHPGLAEALEVDHRIINDIRGRFTTYRELSDKQVALVLKIANEVRNPQARPVEKNVPAPVGRVVVRGIIVKTETRETDFGTVQKMTVKVTTPDGVWLCWGTEPSQLGWEDTVHGGQQPVALRGAEVEFTATLKAGRDPHFALFSRPTKARVIRYAGERPEHIAPSDRWPTPAGGGGQAPAAEAA